jgi:hypothetical protein
MRLSCSSVLFVRLVIDQDRREFRFMRVVATFGTRVDAAVCVLTIEVFGRRGDAARDDRVEYRRQRRECVDAGAERRGGDESGAGDDRASDQWADELSERECRRDRGVRGGNS